jgi:PTH1 family peptidyl-tRNA hydrolase
MPAGGGTTRLWVGLGNPGAEHARQRHNIGFMAIEAVARLHAFGPWRKRFRSELAEGQIGGVRIIGLKPQTYMNASGDAVQAAAAFYRVAVADIWVFHDELDLAPGRLRVKRGGGVAGHNGLRDMQRALATPEFWRVRLGIGHPGHRDRVHGHVLGNFAKQDAPWVQALLESVAQAAPLLAQGRPEEFMTRVALLTTSGPED